MIFKKLAYHFKSLQLKKKFGLIICIAVLLTATISLLGTYQILRKYDALLYEMNVAISTNIKSDIDSRLEVISSHTNLILGNQQIQSNLAILNDTKDQITYNKTRNNLYNTLSHYLFSNPYIKSITMNVDGTSIHMGKPIQLKSETIEQLNKNAHEKQGRLFWFSPNNSDGEIYCIREIREKTYMTMRPLGTLYISIDFDQLLNDVIEDNGDKNHIVILNKNQVIVPSSEAQNNSYISLSKIKEPYVIQLLNGSKQFITHGSLNTVPWTYYNFVDYNSIFKGTQSLKLLFLGLIATAILCILAITDLLVRRILEQFQILIVKMKKFQDIELDGLTTVANTAKPLDELGTLNKAFDEMTINFKKLVNDNYVKQLLIKDAQLKMLHQQINPHFLCNTLDSINWLAHRYKADDISVMAQSLGILFRRTISDNQDFIPLREELDFLNSYIRIQTIRFKEQLLYHMDIPEFYGSIIVPRMMIQPLVENAIKHGMEDSLEPCKILISLVEKEDCYQLQVANSGTSFESNLLEKLKKGDIIPTGTGVGLININTRLQLLYGENYHLIFNNINKMATATITIPKMEEI